MDRSERETHVFVHLGDQSIKLERLDVPEAYRIKVQLQQSCSSCDDFSDRAKGCQIV
jgi:hypothetical protein